MHFAMTAELVAEMAAHDNVIGIKHSSGDLAMLGGFLRAQSDTFGVLTGNAGTFAPALEAGARGGILAAVLFAPELTLQVMERTGAGDAAGAAEAQARLLPLGREIVGVLGVPAVKLALEQVGLRGGRVRSPLQPLGDADAARVRALLAEAGVGALAAA